jgi:hypothetical protein
MGVERLVVDIPVGRGTKVQELKDAESLGLDLY